MLSEDLGRRAREGKAGKERSSTPNRITRNRKHESQVWWHCQSCKHEWMDIRPSLGWKPTCPEYGDWQVTPGLENERWTEIRERIRRAAPKGVAIDLERPSLMSGLTRWTFVQRGDRTPYMFTG
jgi:hypothetical protein